MISGDLELVYEALAEGIDAVGKEAAATYLAKVALALADALGDRDGALAIVRECGLDLVPAD